MYCLQIWDNVSESITVTFLMVSYLMLSDSHFWDLEKWFDHPTPIVIYHQDPCTWNVPISGDTDSAFKTMTDSFILARISISLGIMPLNTSKPEINSANSNESVVASQPHQNCLYLSALFNTLLLWDAAVISIYGLVNFVRAIHVKYLICFVFWAT